MFESDSHERKISTREQGGGEFERRSITPAIDEPCGGDGFVVRPAESMRCDYLCLVLGYTDVVRRTVGNREEHPSARPRCDARVACEL